jgi:pyruvate formate lyase activating enzyme
LGIDPSLRDQNLRTLMALGARVVARMPIIPGFTDGSENVAANVAAMKRLGIIRADILPFHQLGEGKYQSVGIAYGLSGMRQLSAADVQWVADFCDDAGVAAVIHGD